MFRHFALALLLLLLLPALVLAATVTITIGISPAGSGTVQSLPFVPQPYRLVPGVSVACKAYPTSGYKFTGAATASGPVLVSNVNTTTNTFTLTATGSATAAASVTTSFVALPPVLVANAGSGQSIVGFGAQHAVALDGSKSTPAAKIAGYLWEIVSSNASTGHLVNPGSIYPTFYADYPGSYSIRLTVRNDALGALPNSNTTTVLVTSPSTAKSSICTVCHAYRNQDLVAAYTASAHGLNLAGNHSSLAPACQGCHFYKSYLETNTPGGHFFATGSVQPPRSSVVRRQPVDACASCHSPGTLPWPPPGLSFHGKYTGSDQCIKCHDPQQPYPGSISGYPHYSNFTTAQYISANFTCDNCHRYAPTSSFNVYSANYQWAQSGKGNPKSPAYVARDFKLLGSPAPATPENSVGDDCVRCHTATGFANYVSNSDFSDIHAWGSPTDRTRQMLACPTCHTPTPFDGTFSRRTVGRVTDVANFPDVKNVVAWYSYSSAETKKIRKNKIYDNNGIDMRDSNICITCHAGRSVGSLLQAIETKMGKSSLFWRNVDFIDPHGMGAANLMFDGVDAGYNYLPTSIFSTTDHVNIGNEIGQGPCVGCHMTATEKHLFSAVTKDSNGAIGAITTTVCANCHGYGAIPMDAGTLELKKSGFLAAIGDLRTQLVAKGIYFNPQGVEVPGRSSAYYFFTTADTNQQNYGTRVVSWYFNGSYQGSQLMGAAFNLRLLQSEAGCYVHNSAYVKRLLYDSLEYLIYGTVTTPVHHDISGSISPAAKAYLTNVRRIQ